MSFFKTLKFIYTHPLNSHRKGKAIIQYFKWQLGSRILPYPIIYSFTDRAKLIIKKGMTGATGNLYTGLHEYADMCFLLHFLRKEDLFIDIGANIGSYTVLAGAHAGSKVIAFEPIPQTFQNLINNVSLNNIGGDTRTLNVALGAQPGTLDFTADLDTVNHVAVDSDVNTIRVKVEVLNDILKNESPALIKIDVEGFETEVLNGGREVLKKESLKAIIIELNGSGSRYGYDENEIRAMLDEEGFSPFGYDPWKRLLKTVGTDHHQNTIYIRDKDFVDRRLQTAEKIGLADIKI